MKKNFRSSEVGRGVLTAPGLETSGRRGRSEVNHNYSRRGEDTAPYLHRFAQTLSPPGPK
jgi:hypothetical protein